MRGVRADRTVESIIIEGVNDVNRRLTRPRDDRWIAGVCAGLARRFGLSPGIVRLLFVVSCILPGPQFLIYLVLWALMPSE
jgi:phage shock protein PspC (stress-responsive transcriptional regulator)